MAVHQYSNNASTTLAGAVTAGATSISVASAAGFPTQGKFTIVVDSEIMLVTGVAGTTWTVTRGHEGTAAVSHLIAAAVTHVLTRDSFLNSIWYDVRAYGATGDGATDDAAAIQLALNAAAGASVFFPAGTYLIGTTLDVASGQQLIGQGWNSIIKRAATLNAAAIDIADDATDVVIRDLCVDGNRAATLSNGSNMILAVRPVRCRVERVKVQNTPATNPSILFKGGSHNVITACHFDTCGYGVTLGVDANSADACNHNVVQGCTFTTIDLNGIFFTGSLDSTPSTATVFANSAIGNSLYDCGDAAIESGIGCRGTVIVGNTVRGNTSGGTGILVRDNIGTLVSGNYVSGIRGGATSDGISVTRDDANSTDIVIGPNFVRDCQRDGLRLQGIDRVTVTGGMYEACDQYGVVLSTATHFVLTGVVARSNGLSGFRLGETGAAVNNGNVTGCTAYDNSASATTTADGFTVADASSADIVIADCQGYDTRTGGSRTQRYGVNIAAGSNVTLAGPQRFVNNITANINDAGTNTRPMIAPISATATTSVGALANKIQVYDAEGTSLGYIPVYASIT